MALVAKEFGVLPEQAAAAMDEADEPLSLVCLGLLRYAAAHEVFRTADSKRIRAFKQAGTAARRLMEEVEANDAPVIGEGG